MIRVAARLLIDALRRRTEAEGGAATVLMRGDADGGAILLVLVERDGTERFVERLPTSIGGLAWGEVGPADDTDDAHRTYLARRRQSDPDLWIVELANLCDPFALLAELTGAA